VGDSLTEIAFSAICFIFIKIVPVISVPSLSILAELYAEYVKKIEEMNKYIVEGKDP
jgi:hypothetical protein